MDIPAYIISLKHIPTSHSVLKHLPHTKRFVAVDRRKSKIDDVKDIVSDNALLTLKRGRKWHHELSSLGAVGLYESHRKILEQEKGAVLIFEEDAVIDTSFVRALLNLSMQMDKFDVLIFGPLKANNTRESLHIKDFCTITDEFWGLHAVLYSAKGRERVSNMLKGPIDVQLDAKLSRLAIFYDLRLFVQCNSIPLATQSSHISTIQEIDGSCWLCNMDPTSSQNSKDPTQAIIFTILLAFIITSLIYQPTPKTLSILTVAALVYYTGKYLYSRKWASTFHIVVVCTPDYDPIGAYGVNSLMKYSSKHGHQFTLWREKTDDMHISLAKTESLLNTLRRTDADYVVSINADTVIHDPRFVLDELIQTPAFLIAPESQNAIQTNFMIWKKSDRSIELNQLLIEKALENKNESQGALFNRHILPVMNTKEFQSMDPKLAGYVHSTKIAISKNGKRSWELLGKPSEPIDIQSLPMQN